MTNNKNAYELSLVNLFLEITKLNKKNNTKKNGNATREFVKYLSENSKLASIIKSKITYPKKSKVIRIKFTGLDLPKKLANIISFYIFAV